MTPETLHKAAILISSLETRAADALLEQMGPAVAERVRAAVMELPEISEEEQQRVISEFMGRGKLAAKEPAEEVELELSAVGEQKAAAAPAYSPPKSFKRFDYLAQLDAAVIARVLQKEAPQIAAVVLAHLDAKRAAEVLKHVPATIAGDILFRIANLDDMSDDVLVDLEQQMYAVLSPQIRTEIDQARGVARLDAILQALPFASRGSVAAAVAHRDQRLAGRWKDEPAPTREAEPVAAAPLAIKKQPAHDLQFTELAALDDAAWSRVLNTADADTVLLAFAGAETKLIDRLVRGLPRKEADAWRKRFAHPGPVRLRDIDAAQQALADIAVELAEQGLIRIPRRRAFAAAA